MYRHLCHWPILAENRWPHDGRKLTGRSVHLSTTKCSSNTRCRIVQVAFCKSVQVLPWVVLFLSA